MTRSTRMIGALITASIICVLAQSGVAAAAAPSKRQWYLAFLHAEQAQAISQGNRVTVAVIDTGVDARHPDLAGSVLPGVDLLNPAVSSNGQVHSLGHGTRMAGLIAGHGQVRGVAPRATILPVRAVPDVVTAPSAIATGIEWAVSHGAKVINVSAGRPFSDPAEQRAVNEALAADIVVVAGAGNDSGGRLSYPAAYRGVIAVTGIDTQGNDAAVSSVGPQAVVSAPAVDIYSTTVNRGYSTATGYK